MIGGLFIEWVRVPGLRGVWYFMLNSNPYLLSMKEKTNKFNNDDILTLL